MRYANIDFNNIANGPGISVSVYLQGCPFKCDGCFNPETWDFNGGKEFGYQELQSIIEGLNKNGVQRHLSILGGEPLCPENLFQTFLIIQTVKEKYPNIEIYLWTGYTYKELQEREQLEKKLTQILDTIDVLIDGRFIKELKDLTLNMRGSSNQEIINLKERRKINE